MAENGYQWPDHCEPSLTVNGFGLTPESLESESKLLIKANERRHRLCYQFCSSNCFSFECLHRLNQLSSDIHFKINYWLRAIRVIRVYDSIGLTNDSQQQQKKLFSHQRSQYLSQFPSGWERNECWVEWLLLCHQRK